LPKSPNDLVLAIRLTCRASLKKYMVRRLVFGETNTPNQNSPKRRNYSKNLGLYSRQELANWAKWVTVAVMSENTS
jgi:hypothetical protein